MGEILGGLDKAVEGHKYCHGHALVLVGGVGRGGAGRLAARGALRVGAGLVTVGCPSEALGENAARLDAVMLAKIDSASDLSEFCRDPRVSALCLGPGLGAARARDLVPTALRTGLPTVLDADALTAFEGRPQELFSLLHSQCLLTPHAGEFCRIFPDLTVAICASSLEEGHVQGADAMGSGIRGITQVAQMTGGAEVDRDARRDEAVRSAARRCGGTVLLKGPQTRIASPDGTLRSVDAPKDGSAAWLATAGSGDVLAGFCTGLVARGKDPLSAGEIAARLHLECGRLAGPGLIAEDLPEVLPRVLRRILRRAVGGGGSAVCGGGDAVE